MLIVTPPHAPFAPPGVFSTHVNGHLNRVGPVRVAAALFVPPLAAFPPC